MKYLCLAYADEKAMDGWSQERMNAEIDKALAYDDVLRAKGHFIAAEALEPVSLTTTLRKRNGKIVMTDGPFIESKEQLAGFYLIEAANLEEALRLARDIPCASIGTIEVRPICDLSAQKA